MLIEGRKQAEAAQLEDSLDVVEVTPANFTVRNLTFDVYTINFSIRNVTRPPKAPRGPRNQVEER
jgi:demethylmenaquinone methyltransferase/2-methoxy-6-polyprenyl-1,4-benzoquinol methylase